MCLQSTIAAATAEQSREAATSAEQSQEATAVAHRRYEEAAVVAKDLIHDQASFSLAKAVELFGKERASVAADATQAQAIETIEKALSLMSENRSVETLTEAQEVLSTVSSSQVQGFLASHDFRDALADAIIACTVPGDGQATKLLEGFIEGGLEKELMNQTYSIRTRRLADIGAYFVSFADDLRSVLGAKSRGRRRPRRVRRNDRVQKQADVAEQKQETEVDEQTDVVEQTVEYCAAAPHLQLDTMADHTGQGSCLGDSAADPVDTTCPDPKHFGRVPFHSFDVSANDAGLGINTDNNDIEASADAVTDAGADNDSTPHCQCLQQSESGWCVRNTFIEVVEPKQPSRPPIKVRSAPEPPLEPFLLEEGVGGGIFRRTNGQCITQ